MSKVHTFPLISEAYSDTRLPLQYPGNGAAAAPKQMELSLLLSWIEANITLPTNPISVQSVSVTTGSPNISVSAGRLVLGFAITGGGSGTFNVGTAPGGSDILGGEAYDNTGLFYFVPRFYPSSGSLCFDGFSGTLTVKLILINLT